MRKHGATPATIGVLNGVARVGLTPRQLNELTASAGKPDTRKISRRDIAYICGMVNSTFPFLYIHLSFFFVLPST